MTMMVINKFHSDHEEAIRYKSTTLQTWPENAVLLIVGTVLLRLRPTNHRMGYQ